MIAGIFSYTAYERQPNLTRAGIGYIVFALTCRLVNAVAESVFGTLKLELVFWVKYVTRDQAKRNIVDYIEMFYMSTFT